MITIAKEAADQEGMTLEELAEFVQEAMRADIPADATLRVKTGWRSQILRLQVPR